jgi:NADH-quinone oxidoreductase subunit G
MCLIEVEGMPKPQPACAVTCGDGMVVRTQMSSDMAEEAQRSIMEFLLINHPLDCPVCDKGGECPLQNQAMSNGQAETRFDGPRRTFPKPINLSAQVLLDRERCVSCARCTRFSEQIAGDPFIELLDRGPQQQVGIAEGKPFNSYFSGNTIQICPVGALTSAMYRFRSRPFDLVSTPTVCEHCSSGCAQRTDSRRNSVMRRLAAVDPDVNEEWNCDKGRFAFRYLEADDRLTDPMVREDGDLRPASWAEALSVAAEGLRAAAGKVGVVVGGRLSYEDAYAYSKFARVVLETNNVDFRARPTSTEEAQFLAAQVAGHGTGPTYADLETAPAVLLVAFEPEDESPIVLLRLRKAARNGTRVYAIAAAKTRGLEKTDGVLLPCEPAEEADLLGDLATRSSADEVVTSAAEAIREPGSVVLVGERASTQPGVLSAVSALVAATGVQVAWVPRRAGERGAVEAGLLPGLLPGGRPISDASARVDAAAVWGVDQVPETTGLDAVEMLGAARTGEVSALVMAGAEIDDFGIDTKGVLESAKFIVALDTRRHDVTAHADVVFPVAAAPEKRGTFLNWEGRSRPFDQALRTTGLMTDARVLSVLADELGTPIGLAETTACQQEIAEFDRWQGERPSSPQVSAQASAAGSELVLVTWRPLLDHGSLQHGEPYLSATAHPVQVLLSAESASQHGLGDGAEVTVTGRSGSVSGRVAIVEAAPRTVTVMGDVSDRLGSVTGDPVTLTEGGTS